MACINEAGDRQGSRFGITGSSIGIIRKATAGLRATLSVDSAISRVSKGLDADVLHDVRIGNPPPSAANVHQGSLWMTATVTGAESSNGGATIPLAWEADLAEGAVADLISAQPGSVDRVISGINIDISA